MDVQGVVAHLIQDTVILSTAVELGVRWRELAERHGSSPIPRLLLMRHHTKGKMEKLVPR